MSQAPGNKNYSESTLRLAERYGIDPARLDAMLGEPKEGAVPPQDANIHQPNVAATPQTPATKPEPVRITDPNIRPAPTAQNFTPPPKEVRFEGSTLTGGARGSKTNTYEKKTSPVTWLVALLVLGVLAMLYFWRGCNDKPQRETTGATPIDTVIKTDTLASTDTVTKVDTLVQSLPAATQAPAQPRRRASARRSTASSGGRNVALTTTSSFSAQERLAELKADGNAKAHIRKVQKNGVTVYEVRTRK